MRIRSILIPALLLASVPALAQAPVTGDAAAGLVSRTAAGEVHLVADPQLTDKRLVLKIVVLNRGGQPQPFGPAAVTLTADGQPVAVATRDELVGRAAAEGVRDSSQARATAGLSANAAGQTDVTGFTGGSAVSTGGVPTDTIGRAGRGDAPAGPNPIDAVLLKPITLAPGAADGGQVFTARLKRERGKQMEVSVVFGGETHRFAFTAPR